jgi:hypothetical protein
MRTWQKAALGVIAAGALAFGVLAGTSAFFVFRHMDTRESAEADAVRAIDAVKARFGSRPPLIEIADPRRADLRINRSADANVPPVGTIHVLNWKSDTHELVSADMPLWLMRFSSVNIASHLGIAPSQFRLTVGDVERYGPGIVIDYGSPGTSRVLVWVD